MTIDERIERLEFLNAAYVEQRRKDWEDYVIRERDLRSHIDAIWKRQERRDEELDRRWQETREMFRESKREADERGRALDERVDKLVSAIGELCQRLDEKKQ